MPSCSYPADQTVKLFSILDIKSYASENWGAYSANTPQHIKISAEKEDRYLNIPYNTFPVDFSSPDPPFGTERWVFRLDFNFTYNECVELRQSPFTTLRPRSGGIDY